MARHTQTIDIFFQALQFVLGSEFKELELGLCAVSLFSQCLVLFLAFLELCVSEMLSNGHNCGMKWSKRCQNREGRKGVGGECEQVFEEVLKCMDKNCFPDRSGSQRLNQVH